MDSSTELSGISLPRASLSFRDLSFTARLPGGEQKLILDSCCGHFEAGQLVAIMGPSGCGKTTLLDMLAMKKTGAHTGEVLVNGCPVDRELFPRVAAYVGNEDAMPAHWKVREAVYFNARLKLGADQARPLGRCSQLRSAEVTALLQAFDLSDAADTYIGGPQVRGISSGQRRRVMLARGVAAQASILFCDEPTSGLSATDAHVCVKALRGVVQRLGVLAVVVIHQPRKEVAELFDVLVLLTTNPGRMAYAGPMSEVLSYMRSLGLALPAVVGNPADLFLDVVTPGSELDASVELAATFGCTQRPTLEALVQEASRKAGPSVREMLLCGAARGDHSKEAEEEGSSIGSTLKTHRAGRRPSPYAAPLCTQLAALLGRKLLITARNPEALALQAGLPLLMGNVMGAVFRGVGQQSFLYVVSFVFFVITMLSLQSLPVMPLLILERGYMKYETSERLYAYRAAVLMNLCVDLPFGLFISACQSTIVYAYSGLPYEHFWFVIGWEVLVYFFFDAYFSLMAAVARDQHVAIILATPGITVFALFNGFITSKATAPVWLCWIFHISPYAYAIQAITARLAPDYPLGVAFLETAAFVDGQNRRGIIIIVFLSVVCRAVQVLVLRKLHNLQR